MTHDRTIEAVIREIYERNFELLRQEGSGSLSPEVREAGLNQVLLYWMKLRQVAERITDTEVPIHLPNQRSPDGRTFSIEAVVDIVREDDRTIMYDIKTHDPDYVRAHRDLYEMQLNLYAYVWQQTHGQPLDMMAIIATAYGDDIREAIPPGRPVDELTESERARLQRALENWQPLIPIDFDQTRVQQAIRQFGAVVDRIENRQFAPPDLSQLKAEWTSPGETFATRICCNCDARFSCASYRAYARQRAPQNWRLAEFIRYFYDSFTAETVPEDWVAANLNASPEDAYLDALLGD